MTDERPAGLDAQLDAQLVGIPLLVHARKSGDTASDVVELLDATPTRVG